MKEKPGGVIYCDGGGETVRMFLQEKLFDEIIVSIIPVLLGQGIRLFPEGFPEQKLKFVSSKSFEKGLVQVRYAIRS
jgi:dihydrofolate reductase